MSNLSDLLPAGAGGKQVNFVASGTLPSGQTVALKSNGQVAAVSATGIPAAIGAEEVFNSATTASQRITMLTSTKAIVVYQDTGNSSYGTACILTVSGSTITAGTEVVFESASSNYFTVVSFTETQALVVYGDTGNSGIGTYCLLTISGSTITAATPVAFMAGSIGYPDSAKFSATQAIVTYMDGGNSSTYAASLFTLSGTSISVGTAFQFDAVTGWLSSVSKLTATQAIVAYRGGSNYGTSVVLTISGTSFTKGTSVVFNSAATNALGSDTLTATQAIVAFRNSGNSYYGTSCVLNVSGTTVTAGSVVVFETANAEHIGLSALTSSRAVVAYADAGNSGKGTYCILDVSGSTVTAGTPIVYNPTVGESLANSTAALTTSAFLVAYGDTGNSSYGTSIFIQTEGSNSADFIGITDAAISSAASGSVTIKGGISSNVTGLTANSNYYVQTDGSLNTATSVVNYDITNASFTQAFSVSSQDSAPQGVAFNTDGTKMFITGAQGQDVNEYALSTGFDVSTASFTDAFSVSAQDTAPAGIAFNADGTKMFIVGNTGDDVNEYTLSGGFDVSTASFVDSFDVSGQETGPWGLAFNPTGTKMFVCGNASDNVNEYALSAGFDVSTASFTVAFSVGSQDTGPLGLAFNTAGTQMFVLGQAGKDVNEYALSTGFDVSTASFVSTFSVASQETYPNNIAFSSSGAKMFVTGTNVNQYATTSTATNSTTVLAGRALSSTSINLDYTT